MYEDTVVSFSHPDRISIKDPLTEVLQAGARRLLAEAVEVEVSAFIAEHADLVDGSANRRVERHDYLPEREVQTGIGPIAVHQRLESTQLGHSSSLMRTSAMGSQSGRSSAAAS